MSSAATTLLSAVTLSTLTDHLVVDTSLRIPTAKWAQTDDSLSLEIKTACIGDTKRIAVQHDVFNFTCVSRHAGAEHGYALSLKLREDVREGGVDAFVETLNLLYTGGNFGKLSLKV